MEFNPKQIVREWSHRVSTGMPDIMNDWHLERLVELLVEKKYTKAFIKELIKNLTELKFKDKAAFQAYQAKHKMRDTTKVTIGGKETTAGDAKKDGDKKGDEETTSSGGMSSENIDAIDGEAKEGGMNKEVKAPGNDTSTVNEIGVGYAMACMEESPDDVSGCLDKKLDSTKLGKGTSKKKRKQIIQSARAEKKRVDDHMKEKGMDPEKTKVSHVWGSKQSLKGCVDHMKEKGVKEINGIPCNYDEKELYQFDKNGNIKMDKDGNPIPKPIEYDENGVPKNYAQVILNGGGGDDPTDTMVTMVDDSVDPPKVEILHTSNKTTSADIQANGSPNEELSQTTDAAKKEVESEEDRAAIDKADKEAKEKVKDARKRQKEYIGEQGKKMATQVEDDEVADRMLGRLENGKDGDPPGISKTEGKYYKKMQGHPAVKAWMKENGIKPPLTQEQKREMLKEYSKGVSDPSHPHYKLRNDDTRILAEFYGNEKLTTGKAPEEPIYSEKEMKSFYEEQTNALNENRDRLNEIKPGLGDKVYTDRMLHRLHIPSPSSPPNFQLNMGQYDYQDLQKDKDGNLYEQDEDGNWFKIDENGNREENPSDIDKKDLSDTECAVVVDDAAHRHCLGVKEGEDISDGFEVRYSEIKGEDGNYKAMVYDRNGNVVAIQTCRSKSGPGGSVNDTIHYGKDYQRCLAKHTIQNDRCG